MKEFASFLAVLALMSSTTLAVAQAGDDCKKQAASGDVGCAPAVVVTEAAVPGGLGTGLAAAFGAGALAFIGLAGSSSGSH